MLINQGMKQAMWGGNKHFYVATKFILHTVDGSIFILIGALTMTSGMASSHSVTSGVYKARERIHHRMTDRRLLAILASTME